MVKIGSDGKTAARAVAFFISGDGLLVSTRHILDNSSKIRIITNNGKVLLPEGIAAEDPVHDLVLLRVKYNQSPYLSLGRFSSLSVGSAVRIQSDAFDETPPSIRGRVALVENLADDYRWFTVDAHVTEGLSGCPVVDGANNVIGMIRAQLNNYRQGFAVSVDAISDLAAAERPLKAISEFKSRPVNELFDDTDFKNSLSAFKRLEIDASKQRLRHTIERFPRSAACWALLGTLNSQVKNWREAEEAFGKAIAIDPQYSFGWASLAAAAAYGGNDERAAQACVKAIGLQPKYEDSWANIGMASLRIGRADLTTESVARLRAMKTETADSLARKLEIAMQPAATLN